MTSISFRANGPRAMESAQDILNRPQAHQKPAVEQTTTMPVAPKKSHKTRNTILGTIAAAVVVAGALAAGNKTGAFKKLFKAMNSVEKMPDFAKTAVKGMNKAGRYIADNSISAWKATSTFVTNLFSKAEKA